MNAALALDPANGEFEDEGGGTSSTGDEVMLFSTAGLLRRAVVVNERIGRAIAPPAPHWQHVDDKRCERTTLPSKCGSLMLALS